MGRGKGPRREEIYTSPQSKGGQVRSVRSPCAHHVALLCSESSPKQPPSTRNKFGERGDGLPLDTVSSVGSDAHWAMLVTLVVSSGCHNKVPQTGWLTDNTHLVLTVLEAGGSGCWHGSGERSLLGGRLPPPRCVLMREKGLEDSAVLPQGH